MIHVAMIRVGDVGINTFSLIQIQMVIYIYNMCIYTSQNANMYLLALVN